MKSLAIVVLLAGVATADPRLDIGIDEHVGARVPSDIAFTDSTGQRRLLGELFTRERPIVLVMAYARCTMLCSVVLRGIAVELRSMDLTPGREYLPIIVSLDPRETPDEAARRQNKLLADIGHPGERARWPYLVGDEAAVARLADGLGFRYAWDAKTQQYAHPAVGFVLTADGRIAEYVRGVTFDALPASIRRASRGELTTSTARDLLSCFHFDPSLRRYERKLALVFRLGAALVLLSLLALIAGLVSWERRKRS
jgi:protein SCO1/2